jgi:hypothetical protein
MTLTGKGELEKIGSFTLALIPQGELNYMSKEFKRLCFHSHCMKKAFREIFTHVQIIYHVTHTQTLYLYMHNVFKFYFFISKQRESLKDRYSFHIVPPFCTKLCFHTRIIIIFLHTRDLFQCTLIGFWMPWMPSLFYNHTHITHK